MKETSRGLQPLFYTSEILICFRLKSILVATPYHISPRGLRKTSLQLHIDDAILLNLFHRQGSFLAHNINIKF